MQLSNINMKPKLLSILILAALLPLVLSSALTYQLVSKALMQKSYDQLIAIREIKKHQIESFFKERQGDVQVLANIPQTLEAFRALDNAFKTEGGPNGNFQGKGNENYEAPSPYKTVHNQYFSFFKYFMSQYGYYDLFLMDAENGDISFTS